MLRNYLFNTSHARTCLYLLTPKQSGLDDVQALAMNAFDFLCNTVRKLTNDSECVKGLENGKRYLKTRYQLDCTTSELCSHNQNYALSYPSKKDHHLHSMFLKMYQSVFLHYSVLLITLQKLCKLKVKKIWSMM